MGLSPEQHERRRQRIEDCRELYIKHEGKHHELIEREMREMGHTDFHRRSMYDRYERGNRKVGWISRFGFDSLVRYYKQKTLDEQKLLDAGKSSPPGQEGWQPGSADGVVDLKDLNSGEGKDTGALAEQTTPSGRPGHPSLAKEGSLLVDPLGRREGEALWPERFDVKALEARKRQIGSYSFAALYQQHPVPAEGGLFKRSWFKTIPFLPAGLKKKRGWDLAISKNAGADYTATFGVAFDNDGNMYIYDGFRRQIEYPEQRRLILGRILAEYDTEHGIELSANGNAVVQDLRSDPQVRGRSLRGIEVKGDKITRALPWISLAEAGKVFLVRGAWNSEFIEEACSFPLGTHDDQIDAVSVGVHMHRGHNKRLYFFN
jgi:predicted phage terminase large subunit-like protein